MRILAIPFLFVFLFSSCIEERTNESNSKHDEKVIVPDTCICDDLILDDKFNHFYYHKNERTEPYSGVCYTEYTDNDQWKMVKPLQEGKVVGRVIEYYPDGSLMAEYWFNENHVYDSLKRYFPDGRVKYYAIYQYGQIKDILINEVDDSTVMQPS